MSYRRLAKRAEECRVYARRRIVSRIRARCSSAGSFSHQLLEIALRVRALRAESTRGTTAKDCG